MIIVIKLSRSVLISTFHLILINININKKNLDIYIMKRKILKYEIYRFKLFEIPGFVTFAFLLLIKLIYEKFNLFILFLHIRLFK